MSDELEKNVVATDTSDIWENANGFFFSDETFLLNGPFPTKEEAINELKDYVEYLNTPKAVNNTGNLPQCNVKYYGG